MTNPVQFYWGIEQLKGFRTGLGICKMPLSKTGHKSHGNFKPGYPIFDEAEKLLMSVHFPGKQAVGDSLSELHDTVELSRGDLEAALDESLWSGSSSCPAKRKNEVELESLEHKFGSSAVKRFSPVQEEARRLLKSSAQKSDAIN